MEDAGTLPSGRRLLIKRDDLTGLGLGGNKARKLELLCADALDRQADLLVTIGARQSNHARMTAAAGARLGLETHLVLGGPAAPPTGNHLLAELFGAHIHDAGTDDWHRLDDCMHELVQGWRAAGRRPCAIPMGGSSPLGASAYVAAWRELLGQLGDEQPVAVVVASSTGGTQAGMVAGRALDGGPPINGIGVAKTDEPLADVVLALSRRIAAGLGAGATIDPVDVHVDDGFVGGGYAVPTADGDAAQLHLARAGGWVLDRVYTAKAFAGLLAYDRDGRFGDHGDSGTDRPVVFWHTGGHPAVLAPGGAALMSTERP